MADAKIINYGQPIGAGSTAIPDNNATALVIESTDGEEYVRVISTDSGERVVLGEGDGSTGIPVVVGPGDSTGKEFAINNGANDSINFDIGGSDSYVDAVGHNLNIGAGTAGKAVNFYVAGVSPALAIAGTTGAVSTKGGLSTALTGKMGTGGSSSTTITGGTGDDATNFGVDLHVGSAIKIGSDIRTVTVIDSTSTPQTLTVDTALTAAAGSSGTTDGGELFAVKNGDGKSILSVNATGVLGLSTTPDATASSSNLLGIGDPDMFNAVTTALHATVIGNCRDSKPWSLASGDGSTLIGFEAGRALVSSVRTVAIGGACLDTASSSTDVTSVGFEAGRTSGNNSTFLGAFAGNQATGVNNIAIGRSAGDHITTGVGNLILGYYADGVADANNQIAIGNQVVAGGASTASIGDASHVATLNFASGSQSWSTTSDSRIKENVEDAILGLDFINALRPVRFTEVNPQDWPEEIRPHVYFDKERTRKNSDGTEETYTEPAKEREATSTVVVDGLMAQEVKAAADAAGVSFSGWEQQPNGMQRLQYEKFVLPLIAACQDLSAQVTALTARVAELEAGD